MPVATWNLTACRAPDVSNVRNMASDSEDRSKVYRPTHTIPLVYMATRRITPSTNVIVSDDITCSKAKITLGSCLTDITGTIWNKDFNRLCVFAIEWVTDWEIEWVSDLELSAMKLLYLLIVLLLLLYSSLTLSSFSNLCKKISRFTCVGMLFITMSPTYALTFPLPASLKNNYVLLRACESRFDAMNEVQTNPVKKLRQGNSLHLLPHV